MRVWILAAVIASALLPRPAGADPAGDLQAEIQQIKQQVAGMEELKARLATLEGKLGASSPSVSTALKGSKLKFDGRVFAGIFSTGAQGAYPNWGTNLSDAKIRFTFNPSERVTFVSRISANGAKLGDFDYFYLDYAGIHGPASTARLGQRKIDVGQETWVDNPVENMLVTNSVSHVSGYGIGAALLGRLGTAKDSPLYEVGFVNGPKGVTARPSSGLPINVKLGAPLPGGLFASGSWFHSGKLGAADKSAVSVAEVSDAPAGAMQWERKLWELDLRWNYGGTGIRSLVPTGELPPVMLGATYGAFTDTASGAPDRGGKYWFVEGLVRLNERLWSAARYSTVELDSGATARLADSPIPVSSYNRTSIGLGYALTDATQLKTEYAFNSTGGGAGSPNLNQWAIGIATKF